MVHKLLLADDSVTIQRVIELTFSGESVQVIAVGDGEQAIARIQAERPDIVLADIGMPKRNGYDVAAFVKGHPDLKHIPVLLLAGAFEPVDDAKAQQAGCDGVLVKPFEPQHVIARVRELLTGVKGGLTPGPAGSSAPMPRPIERVREPRAESPEPIQDSNPRAIQEAKAAEILRPIQEPRAESPKPIPEPRAESARPEQDPLDGYFDRLGAAFSTLNGSPTPIDLDAEDDRTLPTLDDVLAKPPVAPELPRHGPPASGSNVASGFSRKDTAPASGRTVIADAFSALLALEAGEPGARPVRLTTGPEQPVMTDALIEEVTRRVLQRLAPGVARDAVIEVVSDVAERLVRDEIARIRGK